MPRPRSATNDAFVALLIALVMNALNLFEPLTVDDVCHHYYAEQVAKDPLHPFEFEVAWHQKPVPAWDVMVAPVTSYWWAPALAWLPASPLVWKAWFLPFQWLLCWSLLRLLRRHVRRQPAALTAAFVLGPALLPGVNLMLEVPMLALGFAALLALERAGERRSPAVAALAGLLLGLALQTKYSAMGFFAPFALLAILRRSWREFGIGVVTALGVALAIEGLLGLSHGGGSYFWRQLELTQRRHWGALVRGMVMHVGVLGLPAALLALVGLRAPVWTRWLLVAVHTLGYLLIAIVPDDDERSLASGAPDSLAYLAMALATWGVLVVMLAGFVRTAWTRAESTWPGRAAAVRGFFVVWVLAEFAVSFVVSPFPAARRTLMVVLALTVAAGWLAVRRRGAATAVRRIAAGAIALGVFYQGIDVLEGRACTVAVERTANFTREHAAGAPVWFTGGWGFEYYAPRAGMRPLLRGQSVVQAGDWIAIGSIDGAEEPWFHWSGKFEFVTEIQVGDALPWSLLFGYYSGRRPIEGQSGPRFVVWIYRAIESFHARDLSARVNPWRDH